MDLCGIFSRTVAPREGSPVKHLKVGEMEPYVAELGRGLEISKPSVKTVKLVAWETNS